ncbi:MAG: LuxR C-terminal-related transcriptional regulator [Thermodesulfobacteriota bacterium]
MDYKIFSKKEMVDILDVIQATLACRDRADMIMIMAKVRDLLCADRAICGLGIIDEREGPKILDLVNDHYPEEWLTYYSRENLYKHDPIILHQLSVMRPQFWDEAYNVFVDKPYVDFINRAGDFGLRHGIATGCTASNTDKICVFSFSGDENRFTTHQKMILDVMTPHLFQGLIRMHQNSKQQDCELTEREKEVIRWVKEGKSNWELSMILDISESTVKFHVQNIEKKLNAVNRAHAVALAMDYGMIGETSN